MDSPGKLEIVNDSQRLNACIDAMAGYLAECLSFKDESMAENVSWNMKEALQKNRVDLHRMQEEARAKQEKANQRCPPLGKLMRDELSVKADENQEEYLERLKELYSNATECLYMSIAILQDCADLLGPEWGELVDLDVAVEGDNVALAQYTRVDTFFFRYRCPRSGCENVTVGGMCRMLCNLIKPQTKQWLHDCDRVFCEVHGEPWHQNEQIDDLIDMLAKAIARRLSMIKSQTGPGSELDLVLTTRFLECRADSEFARNKWSNECKMKTDCDALVCLAIVARDGGETTEAQEILLKNWQQLQRVVEAPPQELGLVGENAKRMNLAMLRPIFKTDEPFVLRCRIATSWSNQHGGWAQTAIAQAIKILRGWKPPGNVGYITVATQQHGKGGTRMPSPPGAEEDAAWYALPPSLERDGLDCLGKRIVWLTSFVMQRIAHGSFEEGVVRKDHAVNAAIESMHQCQLMLELIDNERKSNNQGVRIRMFEKTLQNPSGDLAGKLDVAMCKLSGFSAMELDTVFAYKPVVELIMRDLTTRTRKLVTGSVVPEGYGHFANDSLAILLPTIKQRRLSHGLHAQLQPHPVADLLRTLPKLRGWSPLKGQFVIELADFTNAHPALREVLEHHSRAPNSFVSRTSASAHRRTEFRFDSAQLVRMKLM